MIRLEVKADAQQRILRELRVLFDCNSPYIIEFYGSFLNDGEINILLEYMVRIVCGRPNALRMLARLILFSSAWDALKRTYWAISAIMLTSAFGFLNVGSSRAAISSRFSAHYPSRYWFCSCVLYQDVKPSNILINTTGSVKLCDFGVSGLWKSKLPLTERRVDNISCKYLCGHSVIHGGKVLRV